MLRGMRPGVRVVVGLAVASVGVGCGLCANAGDVQTGGMPYEFEVPIHLGCWDHLGSAHNEVIAVDLADYFGVPKSFRFEITGIGWDLTVETYGASWLSEATLRISDSPRTSPFVDLSPALGDDYPGAGVYSSVVVDLTEGGLEDIRIGDGLIRIEGYDTFDDGPGEIDALISGVLTIVVEIAFGGPCSAADLSTPYGVLDLADVQAFVASFAAQDNAADIAAPAGMWDLADVQMFVETFTAGCP